MTENKPKRPSDPFRLAKSIGDIATRQKSDERKENPKDSDSKDDDSDES